MFLIQLPTIERKNILLLFLLLQVDIPMVIRAMDH